MFSQRRSRVALTIIVAVITLASTVSPAAGYISDYPEDYPTTPLAVTTTNPGSPLDGEGFWRQGWGNKMVAQFDLNIPKDTVPDGEDRIPDKDTGIIPDFCLGAIYRVDRFPNTFINAATPGVYEHATGVWNDEEQLALDADTMSTALAAGDPVPAGGRYPYEGVWFLHYRFYSESQVSTLQLDIAFGVDISPPAPVRKVTVKPILGYTGATDGVWFETNRASVTWENMEYDSLSGVGIYEVWLNGEIYDDRVFHLGHTTTSVTIEDLPGGVNKIEVVPVDRARNRGPAEAVTFRSDADIPVVNITAPATNNGWMPMNATFSAEASDSAPIQWVDFKIDGKSVYTDKVAPYTFTKNMSAYSTGVHTLTAVVKDSYGHTSSDTKTFNLDPSVPKITSISDSPDPFYPIIQDGYGDTMSVQFYTSEGGKCALYIYDDTGELYAVRSKPSIGSGWQSISWNGIGSEGLVSTGTFSYKVKVVDAAGNAGYSGLGYTTIRDYEIIRIGPNAVRIVPR